MKKLFFAIAILISAAAFAQKVKDSVPNNWHQLDQATTGYYGISLDKAYAFVKDKKLKSKQVIVAVIDSGIDTLHEDLKPILWTNPKEIPGNGIDDDKNGYIDDIHGWNFIGGKDGRNVKEDSHEAARVYNDLKAKYGAEIPDESVLQPAQKMEVEMYKKAKKEIVGSVDPSEIAFLRQILPGFVKGDSFAITESPFIMRGSNCFKKAVSDGFILPIIFCLAFLYMATSAFSTVDMEASSGITSPYLAFSVL